jgi:hypothetical protein
VEDFKGISGDYNVAELLYRIVEGTGYKEYLFKGNGWAGQALERPGTYRQRGRTNRLDHISPGEGPHDDYGCDRAKQSAS